MTDRMRFEKVPDDHVDWACEELIRRVFGFEGSLITNESTLDHFESVSDDAYPGHEKIRLGDVPLEDRAYYESEFGSPDFLDPEDEYVWYPPLTKEEEEAAWQRQRQHLLSRVAVVFGAVVFEYPDDELYVWKVARFLVERGSL